MYKVLQQVWKFILCKCVRVLANCHFGNVGDQDCRGLSTDIVLKAYGSSPFFAIFSKTKQICAKKLTELGCINYPICLDYKKKDFTRSGK